MCMGLYSLNLFLVLSNFFNRASLVVGFDHVEFYLNPVILEIGKFKRILPFCVPENKTVY